jgi:N6-L-threonylcarbamoyladenine synthase
MLKILIMLILGIETSCDETAASLVEVYPVKSRKAGTLRGLSGRVKVLSNVVSSQVKLHAKYGGIVPSLAAREHVKNLRAVLELAIRPAAEIATSAAGQVRPKVGKKTIPALGRIDLIAVTAGPGLISSLLVGTTFAKTLAWKLNKPIIGVNHIEGHIISNWLKSVGEISNFQFLISKQFKNSKKIGNWELAIGNCFPAVCLVVSGGHTQLIRMKSFGKYKIVGETLDDAAGEAFDKIARILGLGYPGGPAISRHAEKWKSKITSIKSRTNSKFQIPKIELPRPMINSKNFDFSFSGLKTAVLYLVRDLKKKLGKNKLPKELISQIAAEAQQAIVDVLVSKTIRAAQEYEVRSIMLSGGVSANKLLRSELQKNAQQKGIKYFQPLAEYTTDNAAMIALAGYIRKIKNQKSPKESVRSDLTGQAKAKIKESWQKVKADANWEIGR